MPCKQAEEAVFGCLLLRAPSLLPVIAVCPHNPYVAYRSGSLGADCYCTTSNRAIMALSSCSSTWQCKTYLPA